jgi:hypothetical protein
LHGFGNVRRSHSVARFEIRDRTRDAKDLRECSRAEAEPLDGAGQESPALVIEGRYRIEIAGCEDGVAARGDSSRGSALELDLPRSGDTFADGG